MALESKFDQFERTFKIWKDIQVHDYFWKYFDNVVNIINRCMSWLTFTWTYVTEVFYLSMKWLIWASGLDALKIKKKYNACCLNNFIFQDDEIKN
jgi:hypothetical protein